MAAAIDRGEILKSLGRGDLPRLHSIARSRACAHGRSDVSDANHPLLIWTTGFEVALQMIARDMALVNCPGEIQEG